MRKLVIILTLINLCSCENSYEISKDKLESRFGLDHGFALSEIKVSEFNVSGEPTKYERISTAYYISKHKDLSDKESYRTFHFKKANGEKEFEWKWRIDTNMVFLDTLPMKFKNDTWYLLNLSNQSCYIDELFFKFFENGKVIKFHNEGNCGAAW
ncbi:MAG: hypothetical protein GY739_01715 [Mesoflavibacter sp.]|nr:hypothetical protein [Mesoflavibacter sp.]